MKALLTLLFLVCMATAFAQNGDATEQLRILKDLYDNKKITLTEYEQMSKRLLRSDEPATKPAAQPQQPVAKQADLAIIDTTTYVRTEEYCMLIGSFKPFSTKVTVEVDFGQKFSDGDSSKNRSGRLADFESMADALNFMNSKGWELHTAYPMDAYLGVAYHYLLKRKITK